MDMDIGIAVGLCDLIIINFRKPVVCRNCSGIAQDQSSHGISNGRIFLYTPILYLNIAVHHILVIKNGGFHGAHLFPLFTVQNIGLGSLLITGLSKYLFHAVLNILHMDAVFLHLSLKISRYTQSQQIDHIIVVLDICGIKCLHNSVTDLR